ncbi:hypothetical protein CL617_03875 [archaeon]|nr:hypothetical protein [archaeon]|tara:strand:+ start:21685 stop:22254 length:570 start_codon:yes stop_codon:yes gene_type:complete
MNLRKLWKFIWNDNSIYSWIINVVLAFVIVKFLIFPGLGFLLDTSHPLVAVVSCSMEHNGGNFEKWWEDNGKWYEDHGITKSDFENYKLRNGFSKGDIIVLRGGNLEKGDIIVFSGRSDNPIIHRIVSKNNEVYQTKGDNNLDIISTLGENRITEDIILGKAYFRIPYLGWLKVWFSEIFEGKKYVCPN